MSRKSTSSVEASCSAGEASFDRSGGAAVVTAALMQPWLPSKAPTTQAAAGACGAVAVPIVATTALMAVVGALVGFAVGSALGAMLALAIVLAAAIGATRLTSVQRLLARNARSVARERREASRLALLRSAGAVRQHQYRRVFHCPYCDGWEVRDRALVAIAESAEAVALAIELRQWSRDLVLCMNGSTALSTDARGRLERAGIRVHEQRIERVVERAEGGALEVQLRDASSLRADAVFVETRKRQSTDLARQLGCDAYDPTGCTIEKRGHTNVPGLYVIGDASRDVLQIVVAAAEGAEVAIAINTELTCEDLGET